MAHLQPGQPGRHHFRPRVRWVAYPPAGALPPRRPRPVQHYAGPPSYARPPRWGFPNLTWREPTAVPGTPSALVPAIERVRMLSRWTTAVLGFLAALALTAAGSEFWRYALMVISRESALTSGVVDASNVMEKLFAILTLIFGLMAIGLVVLWLLVAQEAAADQNDHEPPRSSREVLLGTLVPGLNLALAGSILAEVEHAVLRRSPLRRPRPSRLVLGWWAAWVVNGVLLVVVIFERFRGSLQAQADSVLLSGILDVSASVLAVLTALVVHRLTKLLAPISLEGLRIRRVVAVKGAPSPELRPVRPKAGSR